MRRPYHRLAILPNLDFPFLLPNGHSARFSAKSINRLPTQRGLTQDDLAGLVEIDRRYVQRIEPGTPNPGIDVIFHVREALCASWDEMLLDLSKSSGD